MTLRLNRTFTVLPLLLTLLLALLLPSPASAGHGGHSPRPSPPPKVSGPARGSAGSRAGKAFTPAGKREIDAANAATHGGVNKCEKCKVDVVPGQKSERGVTPPSNQRERDHVIAKSRGGDGLPSNGQVLCRDCNQEKRDKAP